jgi:hypothetical protein
MLRRHGAATKPIRDDWMKFLAIAALLLALVAPPAAHAHSALAGSIPEDGETVSDEVSRIKLEFTKPVRVTRVRVNATQESGAVEPETDLPASFVDTVEVAFPALEPGVYETQWTAVAQDGHVMNGAFSFTVAD